MILFPQVALQAATVITGVLTTAAASVAFGLSILFGHVEIVIDQGRLRTVERAGPLRWSRSRPLEAISRFQLLHMPGVRADRLLLAGPLQDLGRMMAECEQPSLLQFVYLRFRNWFKHTGARFLCSAPNEAIAVVECTGGLKPMLLAGGYRGGILRSLLHDLSTLCREVQVAAGAAEWARIETVEQSIDLWEATDQPTQPPGSRVTVDDTPEGLTLTIPAAGFRKLRAVRLVFDVLFTTVVWSVLFGITLALANAFGPPAFAPVIAPGLFLLAGAFAIERLLYAINEVRTRTVIAVVGERFLVFQVGIFRPKRQEWLRRQLAAIRCCRTSRRGDEKLPLELLPELQLMLKTGERISLLPGYDAAELKWIATILRKRLQVGAVMVGT